MGNKRKNSSDSQGRPGAAKRSRQDAVAGNDAGPSKGWSFSKSWSLIWSWPPWLWPRKTGPLGKRSRSSEDEAANPVKRAKAGQSDSSGKLKGKPSAKGMSHSSLEWRENKQNKKATHVALSQAWSVIIIIAYHTVVSLLFLTYFLIPYYSYAMCMTK